MTWRIVALALYGITALIIVPVVALVAFALTLKPLYVVDMATIGDFQTARAPRAFPAGYVSLEAVRGGLAIGPGRTARYPDGSTMTIVQTYEASAAVRDYGDSLGPQWSSQTEFAGEMRRDLGFSDGRVMRLLAEGQYLLAFAAPSQTRLARLAAATPAIHRNSEHGWGNEVAQHWHRAAAVGALWFFCNFALIGLAVWRLVIWNRSGAAR
jgi:hypothetical protein